MEGQQVASVVLELGVHAQQAAVTRQVAQAEGELFLRAVHLAEIQEGRQGVDLLPLIGLAAEIVGGDSRPADGGRSERGDAALWAAGGEATVIGRNLENTKPKGGKPIFFQKCYVFMTICLSFIHKNKNLKVP